MVGGSFNMFRSLPFFFRKLLLTISLAIVVSWGCEINGEINRLKSEVFTLHLTELLVGKLALKCCVYFAPSPFKMKSEHFYGELLSLCDEDILNLSSGYLVWHE